MTDEQRARMRAHLKVGLRTAEATIATDGGLIGTFIEVHSPKTVHSFCIGWANDDERHSMLLVAQAIIAACDVQTITILSEVWFVNVDPNKTDELPDTFRPSEQPDKIDGVSAVVLFYDNQTGKREAMQTLAPIEKNGAGKPIGIGVDVMAHDKEPAEMGGAFFALLPRVKLPKNVREAAAKHLANLPAGFLSVTTKE